MKKKIIFVTEALWIGGIETALVNLINRIDYKKYDVTLLVLQAELDMLDRINSNCRVLIADRDITYSFDKPYQHSRLYHLTEATDKPSHLHKLMMWTVPIIRWVENRAYICYIRNLMKEEYFDTAIIYSDRTTETTIRAINAKKYLLMYHNAIMEKAYHDEIGYKKSEKIIAVSDCKAEDLKKFRSKYRNKIIAIHNIVDIDDIISRSHTEISVPFNEKDFNLVTCGRLAHQKAIDWAIIACRKLIDRGYNELQWWVLGGGPDEKKLKKQIEDAGIGDHFHLLGIKDNPYPYIAGSDLYVQTSRYENYSVVILEAMVLCKPILATRPAADQQIQSGINGMLCDAEPFAIADSIEYLYKNLYEREKYVSYLQENSFENENEQIMQAFYNLF